ncbi:MAG: DUF1499 domain-containing protein [Pseudomonadota bacterium]
MKWSYLALLVALIAVVLLLIGGPGARFGLWEFGFGFRLLRYALYAGIAGGVVALLLLLIPTTRKQGSVVILFIALLISLAAAAVPLQMRSTAESLPFIHDITTDTTNPPRFIRLLPLRVDAPNPPDYAGEEVAVQQREAYPDIQTQRYSHTVEQVFAAALETVREQGWEIVAEEPSNGRIEATDTTFWYGFKDDVVIRIETDADGSKFDMRSKSRVGMSDLGTNANRIRSVIGDLDERLGAD